MNPNDLLDHAFGQLDAADRERVERALANDPDTADVAAKLNHAYHLLCDDGESYDPPAGLAGRTLSFVHANVHRRRTIYDYLPSAVPFRPVDIAVAAGILIAGLLTLIPAVSRSREKMNVAGCAFNLQQLGQALWHYGSDNHQFPSGAARDPGAPAGAFVSLLCEKGCLDEAQLKALHCPCSDRESTPHKTFPDFKTICVMQASDPEAVRKAICSDYAYNVGHRHPVSGRFMPISMTHTAHVPLLADQPPHDNLRTLISGNSPNHAGRGQNVLYSDLHIGWHPTRRVGPDDDDMYLNFDHKLSPGLDLKDTTLFPSFVPSAGW